MATGIVNAMSIIKTGIAVTTGIASVNTAIPTTSSGVLPYYIRVAATAACYVKIGKGVQTAVAGDLMIQPDAQTILSIGPNIDNIAVLQVAVAGVLQVSPLENQ